MGSDQILIPPRVAITYTIVFSSIDSFAESGEYNNNIPPTQIQLE